jgi:hypothetical protein
MYVLQNTVALSPHGLSLGRGSRRFSQCHLRGRDYVHAPGYLKLVLKAKDAGVITREHPLYDTISDPSRNLGTPTPEKLGSGVADETSSDTTDTTYDATNEAALQEPKDTTSWRSSGTVPAWSMPSWP